MIAVLRFLFVIPLAFVAGCYAASFALLYPFLDLSRAVFDDPLATIELFIGFTAQAAQIGAAVLVPWAILMMLSEIFAISSLLLHVGIGALGGLALSRVWYGDAAGPAITVAMVVGGLAFLLVYWVVAGRSAGRWRRSTAVAREPGGVDTPRP